MGADMGEAIILQYGGESPHVQNYDPNEDEVVAGVSEFEVPTAMMVDWGDLISDVH
jgi:hypothetical protein